VLFPLVSVGYIFSAFWSKVFFGESMTGAKYLGLGLVVTGCVILGLGRS
jgi:multidrug transporter EmrE-like cation transporter